MTGLLPQEWPEEIEQRHITPLYRILGHLTSAPRLHDHSKLAEAVRGKVVVVTGGSTGLGRSLAKHCSRAGATVIICARNTAQLANVVDLIRAERGRAFAYTVDLSRDDQVRKFATDILRDHGKVDVLVHNAGKSINRAVERSYRRPKDLYSTAGVNYLGPARLTLLLLPYMRARGCGHIINISTAGILMGAMPGWGFYLASKAAFDMWLRSIAPEIRGDGVVTTQYYLGSVRTKMSAPDDFLKVYPSQSADDAAWGVARAIVRRPRAAAWKPYFVLDTVVTALRTPIEFLLAHRRPRLMRDSAVSRDFANPLEDYVYGEPRPARSDDLATGG